MPMRTLARITHRGPKGLLSPSELNSFLPASLSPRLPSSASVYTGYRPMPVSRLPFPSDKRYSSSVADQTKMELPSPQSVLSKVLTSSKHDKWGFVVYRCTSQDDYAWERFKQIFHERAQQALQSSDTSKSPTATSGLLLMIAQRLMTLPDPSFANASTIGLHMP